MAEYVFNPVQAVSLNQAAVFDDSIPCKRGYVFHENESGIFILRGIVNNCGGFARYQVTYNGNIAIPEGGETVVPIAVALAVNGETRPTSRSIITPAAVDEYWKVSGTAIIDVPKGCCFSVSLRHVPASEDPTVTPAPVINIQNSSLVVSRIA